MDARGQADTHCALQACFQWEAVDVSQEPTHVILDLGCTKAIGSRKAIDRLVKAIKGTHLQVEWLPSSSTFHFANSQAAKCTQKLRVHFGGGIWTDFEVLEQGSVPLLMSLYQMRSLGFNLGLTHGQATLTSEVLGIRNKPLKTSTSQHLVLDLRDIKPSARTTALKGHAFAVGKSYGDPNCPACQGKHRPHTCVKGKGKGEPEASKGGSKGIGKSAPAHAEPPMPPPAAPPAQGPKPTHEPSQQKTRATEEAGAPGSPGPEQLPGSMVEEEAIEPPPAGEYPIALRRLRTKLGDPKQLSRLHVQHYHMSPAMFRRRTSMMGLPESIYERYEDVVKKCPICAAQAPKPFRSHASGLRAHNFGDLIFVDHLMVSHGDGHCYIFIVLDGATNMVWAVPTRTKTPEEAMEALREWMDNKDCRPKHLVADRAFATGDMDRFLCHYNIQFMDIGARTPWPNRAESAVRLFKRMFHLLSTARIDPGLPAPTLRQLCCAICWARNAQLTMSGFSPVELATGRRRPDIADVETAQPDQLSSDPLPSDRLDRALRLEAMQAHLRARQMEDVRHDVARRLRPSDGP